MYQIIGTKIRKLREEIGLTQEELAKSVGLSNEFISFLELGQRAPRLESLSSIAKFLKKDISYFIVEREEAFSFLFKREGMNRKTKRVLKKFQNYCDNYLRLEELTRRHLDLAPLYTHITAEKMAAQERRRLGLGNEPIRDIFSLLELNGLRVLRHPVSEELKISGVFIFIELKQAAFALVNSNQSFGYQVFVAAHEYCHYLKHRYDGPVVDNPDIFVDEYLTLYHKRERFAHTFASHFLIPPEKVQEIIEKDIRVKRLNFEDILYLKRYFGVSTIALLRTLKELEYLSQTKLKEYQKLDSNHHEEELFGNMAEEMQQKKGRSRALLSDRFQNLAIEAYRKKKINKENLAIFIGADKEKLESMLKI